MVNQDPDPETRDEPTTHPKASEREDSSGQDRLISFAYLVLAIGITGIAVSVAAGVWLNASGAPGATGTQWGLFFAIVSGCVTAFATLYSIQTAWNRRHDSLIAKMDADRKDAEKRREADRQDAERKREADRQEAERKREADREEARQAQADFRASVDGVLNELRDMNGRQSHLEGRFDGMS